MKKRKLLYLFPLAALILSGCDFTPEQLMFWKKKAEEQTQQEQEGGEQQGGEHQGEEQQTPKEFTGLALNDSTVTYDGQAHTLTVSGELPEGASVSYGEAGNSFTAVGDHEITATISAEGYTTLTLTGTLHIVSAQFAGLSFEGDTVTYDGQPHSIAVSGELPTGATVDYGAAGNTFTNAGAYEITATVHCEGYTDAIYTATLTINKADFVGIEFEDAQVAFDGQPHSIAPVVPAAYEGAEVTYGEEGNEFTGSGLHVVTATVSLANYNDWTKSANLIIGAGPVASANLDVVDFEGLTDNDLADEFELKFFKEGEGWINPQSFKVGIEKNQVFGTGKSTMKMTMTHQGSAFKATKELGNLKTYNKYNGFAIDTMMDSRATGGTMKVQVQFWLKDLPLPEAYAGYRYTYATYTLSNNAPSIWTHWEIPFDDPSLSICSGAVPVSALAAFGMTAQDLTAYISEVAIVITPNYVSGQNCYAYVDNIELTTSSTKSVEKHLYGGKYVHVENDNAYALQLADDLLTGSFLLNDAKVSDLTIVKQGESIIAKDAQGNGAGLTVTAKIENNGSLTVVSVEGQAAATYSGLVDLNFAKYANINLDFTGATTGKPLNDPHWYQEYWKDTWLEVSGKMNVRGTAEDPHCNMTTGYSYDYRYTYTYPEHFGLADKFSIDISNDFANGSHDLKLKIKLISATGGETFVVGTSSSYELIPANTAKWLHIENNNFGEVNVKAIVVVVKSTGNYDQYLYFDNLMLSHSTPEVTPPQPTYTVEDGDYYIWNGNTDAFRLTISNSLTEGLVTKVGGDSYPMTVAVDGETVTIKDSQYGGQGLTLTASITANNTMKITAVSGQMASLLSGSLLDKTVKHCANVNLDFANGAGEGTYSDSHWAMQEYVKQGDTYVWTDKTPDMNSRKDASQNKVVNLVAGGNPRTFTYTPDLPIGPVNHVEFDMANYHNASAGNITVKVCVIDGGGTKYFALGDANNFITIAKDTSQGSVLNHYDLPINLCAGAKVQITVKAAAGSSYLYIDNLKVNYSASVSKVSYKLTDTSDWDINTDTPDFYAWVWGGSDPGHWEKLTLKTDDGKYFDLKLFNTYTFIKIVRVDPAATTKPKQGSYSYGTYENNEIWNETGDIALNGTGGTINFSL